jgi:heat shock protein HslJ
MELEQTFLARLEAVDRYTYLAGQLALSWRKDDEGGVLLFRK